MAEIKQIMQQAKAEQKSKQSMQMLDLVASLKPINRRVYEIKVSLGGLVEKCLNSEEFAQSINELEYSRPFLPQRLPFYSMQELTL